MSASKERGKHEADDFGKQLALGKVVFRHGDERLWGNRVFKGLTDGSIECG